MRRGALLAVLASLACAPADAATVSQENLGGRPDSHGNVDRTATVVVEGTAGEASRLTVRQDGRSVTLADPVNVLTAEGPSCTAADAHTVRCTAAADAYVSIVLRLGDGDDHARLTADAIRAEGGEGADVLDASAGLRSRMDGGPGDDTLTGGTYDDTLVGGPGVNRIDGGPGLDAVRYATAVDLNLAAGRARTADGEDVLTGIEAARGSSEADRLVGGPGPDDLQGGRGADVILGGDGNDRLDADSAFAFRAAGPDTDFVDGGAGDDVIESGGGDTVLGGAGDDHLRGASAAVVDCGDGEDLASGWEPAVATAGCERVLPDSGVTLRAIGSGSGWSVRVRIDCAQASDLGARCPTRVALRGGGRVLARRRAVVPVRPSRVFRIPLGPAGARLLRERGRLRVQVRVRTFLGVYPNSLTGGSYVLEATPASAASSAAAAVSTGGSSLASAQRPKKTRPA